MRAWPVPHHNCAASNAVIVQDFCHSRLGAAQLLNDRSSVGFEGLRICKETKNLATSISTRRCGFGIFCMHSSLSGGAFKGKCLPRAGGISSSTKSWRQSWMEERSKKEEAIGGVWRIYKVEVPIEQDPGKDDFGVFDGLLEIIASSLGFPAGRLPRCAVSVVRKSFDARRDPKFVYTVDLHMEVLSKVWPGSKQIVSRLRNKSGKMEFSETSKSGTDLMSRLQCDLHAAVKSRDHGQADTEMDSEVMGARISCASQASTRPHRPRVVVVGSGPAGLFAALALAECNVDVILVERGQPVQERGRDIGALMVRKILDPDSNFCYGEGGAGTWSDGKLTTRIGKNGVSVQTVLATLVKFGAPSHILIDGKPHIGTDKLIHILRAFRQYLQGLGVNIMFGTKMEDLVVRNGQAVGVKVTSKGQSTFQQETVIEADAVVLGVGHSARDVYEKLLSHNLLMTTKDFAVGFRVEHPQELINEIQYRKWAAEVQRGKGKIPVADYKVATNISQPDSGEGVTRGCHSFCMCPGGQIVTTSTNEAELCINGMSYSKRSSKWANAAIVVSVSSSECKAFVSEHEPLPGVAFQRQIEQEAARQGGGRLMAPAQTVPDFLDDVLSGDELPPSSYRLGVRAAQLHHILPAHLIKALKEALIEFDRQVPGFIDRRALLHGVETRTSSPVRIDRDKETFECLSMKGLYPVGEGAGYAGGIVTAAVDGMHAGIALAKRLYPTNTLLQNLVI